MALNKLQHDCLIFKLKQNDIYDGIPKILKDFSVNRTQRVIFHGQDSSRAHVKPEVSHLVNSRTVMVLNICQ